MNGGHVGVPNQTNTFCSIKYPQYINYTFFQIIGEEIYFHNFVRFTSVNSYPVLWILYYSQLLEDLIHRVLYALSVTFVQADLIVFSWNTMVVKFKIVMNEPKSTLCIKSTYCSFTSQLDPHGIHLVDIYVWLYTLN